MPYLKAETNTQLGPTAEIQACGSNWSDLQILKKEAGYLKFYFNFFNVYFFIFEREREGKREREKERERQCTTGGGAERDRDTSEAGSRL